jgi:trehalose 6-phosphate synthase/phosphatase
MVALTWHYRNADHNLGVENARQCHREILASVSKNYDIEIMPGKMNLEVRPKFVNKGEIAKSLLGEYDNAITAHSEGNTTGAEYRANDLQFVLCLGDDSTDEDMFRAIQQSPLPAEYMFPVTVGVNSKQTLADWHVLDPNDVVDVVEGLLVEFRGE